MNHPASGAERRRDPSEYFGLERALWDDRHDGQLRRDVIRRLRRAELQLSVALDACAGDERLQAMVQALQTAQGVLNAAAQAMSASPAAPSLLRG